MELSASTISYAFTAMAVIIMPLTGVLCALLPFLMPKRECFTVTIPDDAQDHPTIRSYKRAYVTIMLTLTAVLTAAIALAAILSAFAAMIILMGGGLFALCAASYALMFHFRSKVRHLKEAEGWRASGEKAVAMLGDEPMPRALSLKWDLLFLPGILVPLIICLLGYGSIPDQIPGNIDLDGQVTNYYSKSIAMACFPALIVAFVDSILIFGHWQILRSKKGSDPALPAATAWAYGRFANVQTKLLVISGIVLGFVGLAMAASFVGIISLGTAAIICLACAMIVAIGSIAIAAVYGQNGSRLIARVSAPGPMAVDDDRYWKAGIFYVNRDDPSLFLPERFGIGWTMNWGRPAAWAILFGLLAVLTAFIVAVFFLTA